MIVLVCGWFCISYVFWWEVGVFLWRVIGFCFVFCFIYYFKNNLEGDIEGIFVKFVNYIKF